jgi:DNA-binding MarR family transcriptional regulator
MVLMNFIAEHGGVRSADIIRAFGQAPRTVTEAIDAMEADGHVERLPDPSDRRAKIVSLTAAGRKFFDEVNPLHERVRERIFGALSSQEQSQFAELLDKLNTRLLELEAGIEDEQAKD